MEEADQNMFTLLEKGDRRIENIHNDAIILVGISRSGKSTTFNWILKKFMKGYSEGAQVFFKNEIENSDSAQISDGFTSTTLIPNIAELNQYTSLLDMAGFLDNRSYVGVMGVSYFLKSVFEKVKRVRFIIVLSEGFFSDGKGDSLIKTFQGFLRMFHIQNLIPSVLSDLFNSVTLLITRSPPLGTQGDRFKSAVNRLRPQKLKFDQKDLILKLLDHVIDLNRICYFQAAIVNQPPEPCNILQKVEDPKFEWKPFDLERAGISCNNQHIINIPFKDDLENLSLKEAKKFKVDIDEKINAYSEFVEILKVLINSLLNNWKDCVKLNFSEESLKNFLKFDSVFNQISIFLQESDKYNTTQQIRQEARADYALPNFVNSLNHILKIFQIILEIGECDDLDFLDSMKRFGELFGDLANCIMPFCHKAEDEMLILRLNYVLKRGFKEFSKFYEIDRELISRAKRDMKDKCTLEVNKQIYLKKFMSSINIQILSRLFKTISELQQFQILYNEYVQNFKIQEYGAQVQAEQQKKLKFKQMSCNICQLKTKLYITQGKKAEACKILVHMLDIVREQAVLINNLKDDFSIQLKIQNLQMQRLLIIKKLAINLSQLQAKKYPNIKNNALNLFTIINDFHQTCKLYQTIINEQQSSPQEQSLTLNSYASYCRQLGLNEKAKQIYFQKLSVDISINNYSSYNITLLDISQVMGISPAQNNESSEHINLIIKNQKWEQLIKSLLNDSDIRIELDEILTTLQ